MIVKVSLFDGSGGGEPVVVPLGLPQEEILEKTGSALLPEVRRYISGLRPQANAQYVLVNALGAGEFYGSNVNGDFFGEASLIHSPEGWTGDPLVDRELSSKWPYGYPTFYRAKPFIHHRNKSQHPHYGQIELAAWNPHMKRVELVIRLDKELCERGGAISVWDKIRAGGWPDVSMGCRVPWDLCSICTDWSTYRTALATHDPKRWKSPGEAVLHYHRTVKPIRGLAVTRKDYCQHARDQMNVILPGGRKVFVYNEFPDFFDISFVFIGADKTAKTMLKIAADRQVILSGFDAPEEKEAGMEDLLLKTASKKQSEIVKDVLPQQFARKAVPVMTDREADLPDDVLEEFSRHPLADSLGSAASVGVVLRPREFQRVVLIRMGERPLADHLDHLGVTFGRPAEGSPGVGIRPTLMRELLPHLLPLLGERSAFGPYIEPRVLLLPGRAAREKRASLTLDDPLLAKIASAYCDYRDALLEVVAFSQTLLHDPQVSPSLRKLASLPVEEIFTPLSVAYLKDSFSDEYTARGA